MCFCTPSIRTPFCINCNVAMFKRIDELRAELAALKQFVINPQAIIDAKPVAESENDSALHKDAKRYQWMRQYYTHETAIVPSVVTAKTPAMLDAAIDYEMTK